MDEENQINDNWKQIKIKFWLLPCGLKHTLFFLWTVFPDLVLSFFLSFGNRISFVCSLCWFWELGHEEGVVSFISEEMKTSAD